MRVLAPITPVRLHSTHPPEGPFRSARLAKDRVLARQGWEGNKIAPFAAPPALVPTPRLMKTMKRARGSTEENKHWRCLAGGNDEERLRLVSRRNEQRIAKENAGGSYPIAKNNSKGSGSSELCLEAPSGFEPLHRSFADCSLSHLGTAPRGRGII